MTLFFEDTNVDLILEGLLMIQPTPEIMRVGELWKSI